MLKERRYSFNKTHLSTAKETKNSAYKYKPKEHQAKLMNSSLSNKLWSMVKSNALKALPQKPLSKDFMDSRTVIRKTKSINNFNSNKRIVYEDVKKINAKENTTLIKNTFKNLRTSYNDKTKNLCRQTCKYLLYYVKSLGEHNTDIWKLTKNIAFNIILIFKKTNDRCEINIVLPMKSIVKLMVKGLLIRKYYNQINPIQLAKSVKSEIEIFLRIFGFKTIQVRFDVNDTELHKFYELYAIQTDNNRVRKMSSFSLNDTISPSDRKKLALDSENDKEEIQSLVDIIREDYEKRLVRFNKLYFESKKEKQSSIAFDELQRARLYKTNYDNKVMFLQNQKELPRQRSSIKNQKPIIKRFTMAQGLLQTHTTSENAEKRSNSLMNNSMKKHGSIFLKKDRSGSLIINNTKLSSGSRLYISNAGEQKIRDFYKPDNSENIDKALDFIDKKNLATVSFGKFKKAIEGIVRENNASKFGYKASEDDMVGEVYVDNFVLENNMDLFNNYFEDYNF